MITSGGSWIRHRWSRDRISEVRTIPDFKNIQIWKFLWIIEVGVPSENAKKIGRGKWKVKPECRLGSVENRTSWQWKGQFGCGRRLSEPNEMLFLLLRSLHTFSPVLPFRDADASIIRIFGSERDGMRGRRRERDWWGVCGRASPFRASTYSWDEISRFFQSLTRWRRKCIVGKCALLKWAGIGGELKILKKGLCGQRFPRSCWVCARIGCRFESLANFSAVEQI